MGLIARPTAGLVDFASGSFDAVKRATELSEEVNRLRPPRALHGDGVLRPFCLREAEGNKLLKYVQLKRNTNQLLNAILKKLSNPFRAGKSKRVNTLPAMFLHITKSSSKSVKCCCCPIIA